MSWSCIPRSRSIAATNWSCRRGASRSSTPNARSDRRSTIHPCFRYPVKTAAVVVTNSEVSGKTIGETRAGPRCSRRIPRVRATRHRAHPPRIVDGACNAATSCASSARPTMSSARAKHVGFVERDLSKTDLTFLAGGICAGILLGLLKLQREPGSCLVSARRDRFS